MVTKTFTNAIIEVTHQGHTATLDFTYNHQTGIINLESPSEEAVAFDCSIKTAIAKNKAIKQGIDLAKKLYDEDKRAIQQEMEESPES